MIFGLNLPNYSSLGHRDAVVAIAEHAEQLGYASLWTSDHVLLPQRDPLLAAKQAATVQHLSGGRLTVGVGWIEQEYGFLRSDFAGRGHTADEYIPAMRALFGADKPESRGPHISYSGVLFSPRPSPRLLIRSRGRPAGPRDRGHGPG